jgi:uncharacterized membrane protein
MSDPTAPSSLPPEQPSGSATTPPVPSQPAPQAAASGTGLAPNLAAGLACVFGLIGGVIFLVLEKKDQYVRFWAMQSAIFGGASFVFWILVMILAKIPLIGVLIGILSLLVWLGIFVVWVIMVIKSFTGKEWEMPFIGKIAREQLAKMPTAS